MHIPQSWSPVSSAMSAVPAGKARPHLQLPQAGMPHAPRMQHVPLPGNDNVDQTPFPASYLPQFSPHIPPVPLPFSPAPSFTSSHSTHTSHRSRTTPQLHPVFSGGLEFLVSSFPFTQDILRVPQRYNLKQDAFNPPQTRIQIQIAPGLQPFVVQSLPGLTLTIEMISYQVYEYLHTDMERELFCSLPPGTQAAIKACAVERSKRERRKARIEWLDVLGFGLADVMMVGLKKIDAESYTPVFSTR